MNSNLEDDFKKKFKLCLEEKNYDFFLDLEFSYYQSYIKNIETLDHYNQSYYILNSFEESYGKAIQKALNLKPKNKKPKVNKICYFLASLDNDLAHIELLESILNNHKSNSCVKIYIAGYSVFPEIKSILLKKLHIENNIGILNIPRTHSALLSLIKYIFDENFSKFIVYSIPFHLYAFLQIFGDNDLKWITTRFELDCFSKLKNLISFNNSNKTLKLKSTNWIRIQATLPLQYKFRFNEMQDKKEIQLVTIGRESKICDITFLNTIKSILLNNQNTSLAIGGFSESSFLDKFFSKYNLNDRVSYLGWVNPKECMNKFDIYLDTPQSGILAASAFASGMPTATLRNSNSYVESFEDEIVDLMSKKNFDSNFINMLISDNYESYETNLNKLISNFQLRKTLAKLQAEIGNIFFYNSIKSYNDLIYQSLL